MLATRSKSLETEAIPLAHYLRSRDSVTPHKPRAALSAPGSCPHASIKAPFCKEPPAPQKKHKETVADLILLPGRTVSATIRTRILLERGNHRRVKKRAWQEVVSALQAGSGCFDFEEGQHTRSAATDGETGSGEEATVSGVTAVASPCFPASESPAQAAGCFRTHLRPCLGPEGLAGVLQSQRPRRRPSPRSRGESAGEFPSSLSLGWDSVGPDLPWPPERPARTGLPVPRAHRLEEPPLPARSLPRPPSFKPLPASPGTTVQTNDLRSGFWGTRVRRMDSHLDQTSVFSIHLASFVL